MTMKILIPLARIFVPLIGGSKKPSRPWRFTAWSIG
jgi:hypothetical protein